LIAATYGFAAIAESNKTLIIASFPFPPLLHATQDGNFSGTMGETVKMMCEEAKLRCIFKVVPLKRAHHELESGSVDALITIKVDRFHTCCRPSKWSSPWAAGFFANDQIDIVPTKPNEVKGHSIILVQGMQSPYLFMPDLEQWEDQQEIRVSRASSIAAATRMFNVKRAPLLWGSDDFNWYFEKINSTVERTFTPLLVKPVVVWVRNSKSALLDKLNQAYQRMQFKSLLNEKNLLIPSLMKERYLDAPFDYR